MLCDIFLAALGGLLHRFRLQRQLSQAQVASDLGISSSLYSRIECGRLAPRHAVLRKLVEYYGLDVSVATQLEQLRSRAKNLQDTDAGLPDDIQSLLGEIRHAAKALPTRYVRALRREIREVVGAQD